MKSIKAMSSNMRMKRTVAAGACALAVVAGLCAVSLSFTLTGEKPASASGEGEVVSSGVVDEGLGGYAWEVSSYGELKLLPADTVTKEVAETQAAAEKLSEKELETRYGWLESDKKISSVTIADGVHTIAPSAARAIEASGDGIKNINLVELSDAEMKSVLSALPEGFNADLLTVGYGKSRLNAACDTVIKSTHRLWKVGGTVTVRPATDDEVLDYMEEHADEVEVKDEDTSAKKSAKAASTKKSTKAKSAGKSDTAKVGEDDKTQESAGADEQTQSGGGEVSSEAAVLHGGVESTVGTSVPLTAAETASETASEQGSGAEASADTKAAETQDNGSQAAEASEGAASKSTEGSGAAASATQKSTKSASGGTARLASGAVEYDLTSAGAEGLGSTINFDGSGQLYIGNADFAQSGGFARESYSYTAQSITSPVYGVSATIDKIGAESSFTLRWNNVGYDANGNRVDFELRFYGFKWNRKDSKPKKAHVIGNVTGSNKLHLMAFDWNKNSKMGAKFNVEGSIYLSGQGTYAAGTYAMIVNDIDQYSKTPDNADVVDGDWAERVKINWGYDAESIHLAPNTWLNRSKAAGDEYVLSSNHPNGYTSQGGGVLCSFARGLNPHFNFTWSGSQCASTLFSQLHPHRVVKETDAGGLISHAGYPLSMSEWSRTDRVNHLKESPNYEFSAREGYYVKAVYVDGGNWGKATSHQFVGMVSDHYLKVVTARIPDVTFTPPTVTKSLTGRSLMAGQFTFGLYDSGGNLVSTASNTIDGTVSFPSIKYTYVDSGKTFTYTVREIGLPDGYTSGTEVKGYTYDTHVATLTVKPTFSAASERWTINNSWTGSANFTNVYKARGKATLKTSKKLEGRQLGNEQFQFKVSGPKVSGSLAKNDIDGIVTFPDINYTEADAGRTYNYQISEVTPNLDGSGYKYDRHTASASVSITDNGDGTLTCKVSYGSSNSFTNTYRASGYIELEAHKMFNVTGSAVGMTVSQFEFELLDSSNKVIATSNANAGGDVKFPSIFFDNTQLDTEHKYRIREKVPDRSEWPDGMTYDTHVTDVTVNLSDNGDGTISCTASYDGSNTWTNGYVSKGGLGVRKLDEQTNGIAGAKFGVYSSDGQLAATITSGSDGWAKTGERDLEMGTYKVRELVAPTGFEVNTDWEASIDVTFDAQMALSNDFCTDHRGGASVTIEAKKVTVGMELARGMFTFQLLDSSGSVIEEVVNDAAGNVVFSPMRFTSADIGRIFTYTVKEVRGSRGGVTYDSSVKSATVRVTDDGSGMPKTTLTYGGDMTFRNSYAAVGTASLNAVVRLVGKDLTANMFQFAVYDENGRQLDTRRNGLSGTDGPMSFSTMNYTQADIGVKRYTIVQICGEDAYGLVYDRHIEEVEVQISDNGDGTLSCIPVYDASGPLFVNVYTAHGSVSPVVHKTLANAGLSAGQFSFELYDSNNVLVETAVNDASGNVRFSPIGFDQDDRGLTYQYTVREVADGQADIVYDTSIVTLSVVVSDNGDGTLSCEPQFRYGSSTFANSFTIHGGVRIKKVDQAGEPLGGAKFGVWRQGQSASSSPLVTLTSGDDGEAATSSRAFGAGTYFVRELAAPSGYVADAGWSQTFSVTQDGQVVDLTGLPCANERKSGEASISAIKVLRGDELDDGAFSFELVDPDGRVVQTKDCAADGWVHFDQLDFDAADVGQSFVYTIREVVPDAYEKAGGMEYDEHVEKVTVNVTEADSGMNVEVVYDDWRTA